MSFSRHGPSSSSLISHQLETTTMKINNASFTLSLGERLFGKIHQGHVNWDDMKDVQREVNKYQRDFLLCSLVLPSGPFLSLYLFKCWRKGGNGERIVYTSQLEADRTFYNPVSCVWENAEVGPRPLEISPIPSSWPYLWMTCSLVQTHTCCPQLPSSFLSKSSNTAAFIPPVDVRH